MCSMLGCNCAMEWQSNPTTSIARYPIMVQISHRIIQAASSVVANYNNLQLYYYFIIAQCFLVFTEGLINNSISHAYHVSIITNLSCFDEAKQCKETGIISSKHNKNVTALYVDWFNLLLIILQLMIKGGHIIATLQSNVIVFKIEVIIPPSMDRQVCEWRPLKPMVALCVGGLSPAVDLYKVMRMMQYCWRFRQAVAAARCVAPEAGRGVVAVEVGAGARAARSSRRAPGSRGAAVPCGGACTRSTDTSSWPPSCASPLSAATAGSSYGEDTKHIIFTLTIQPMVFDKLASLARYVNAWQSWSVQKTSKLLAM